MVFALLFGAAAAIAAPTDENQIIVPNSTAGKASAPGGSGGAGTITFAAVILLAGAGGWFLWRSRTTGIASSLGKVQRQLVLEETRSLGNRQFLVVAGYQDKKFLLGVCPGKIELLAPLTASTPVAEKLRQ